MRVFIFYLQNLFILMDDYYRILGLEPLAGIDRVQKAYKAQALKLHPDKNRNDPKANEKFLVLVEAHAVLSDAKAKSTYDEKIRIENERKERLLHMDSHRRALRDDLLARERQAASRTQKDMEDAISAAFQKEVRQTNQ